MSGSRQAGRLSGAIYGQIVVTSMLAATALEGSLGPVAVLASVLATLLALWIAHVYSDLIARRVTSARRLGPGEVMGALTQEWPIVQAVVPAAVALLLAAVGVWSRDTAVDLALGAGVLSLFGWGLVIGRRSGLGWPRSCLWASLSGVLGLLVVGVELLVH